MPVPDLKKYSDQAGGSNSSTAAPSGGSPESMNIRGLKNPRATTYTTEVPKIPQVTRFSNQSLNPGNKASQPVKNGGRAGAWKEQPKVGTFKDAKHPISGAELY